MSSPTRREISRLTASARSETPRRAEIRMRTHTVVIEDAVERGGTDQGPNPPETFLGSMAGCLNIQMNCLAKERGITMKNINLSIDADFDRRGVTWGEDVPLLFPGPYCRHRQKRRIAEQARGIAPRYAAALPDVPSASRRRHPVSSEMGYYGAITRRRHRTRHGSPLSSPDRNSPQPGLEPIEYTRGRAAQPTTLRHHATARAILRTTSSSATR